MLYELTLKQGYQVKYLEWFDYLSNTTIPLFPRLNVIDPPPFHIEIILYELNVMKIVNN